MAWSLTIYLGDGTNKRIGEFETQPQADQKLNELLDNGYRYANRVHTIYPPHSIIKARISPIGSG